MRGMYKYSMAIVGMALIATCWAQSSAETSTAATGAMQNDEANSPAGTTPADVSPEGTIATTSNVPPLNHHSGNATQAKDHSKDGEVTMTTTTTMKTETTKGGSQANQTEKPKDNGSYVIHSSIALLLLSVLSAIYQS